MKRRNDLDAVCGVLILYMIAMHISQWTGFRDAPVFEWLGTCFFFFMPWFFFKAGMFFRPCGLKETCIRGGGRLLIPFVVYSIIGTLVSFIRMLLEGDTDWVHYLLSPFKQLLLVGSVSGNLPLWFLLTLFMVRLLSSALLGDVRRCCAVAAVCAVLATLLNIFPIHLPLYVANTLSGMSFFAMGYVLRERQYSKYIWLLLVVYVAFMLSPYTSYVDMRANKLRCGYYAVWLLSSLAGCVLINNIFRRCQFLQLRFLSSVGRDSMNYYVMHWIVIEVVYIVVVQLLHCEDNLTLLVCMLSSCLVLLPLANVAIKRLENQYKHV